MADINYSLDALRADDIKENVKTYLNDNGFNFTAGSNTDLLLSGLSYFTMMMNYQMSNIENNIYLEDANTRKNAVKLAKNLNYTIRRKVPAQSDISVTYEDPTNRDFQIKSTLTFVGSKTGYPYIAKNVILTKTAITSAYTGTCKAYQEEEKVVFYSSDGSANQTFILPNKNISNRAITVMVSSNSGTSYVDWEEFQDYDEIADEDSKIFWINESDDYEYYTEISFGNDVIGKIPYSGTNTIKAIYNETHGDLGNGDTKLILQDARGLNNSNLSFTFTETSGGADTDTLDDIKFYAQKYYTNRFIGVTKDNFEVLLSKLLKSNEVYSVVSGDEFKTGSQKDLGNIYVILSHDYVGVSSAGSTASYSISTASITATQLNRGFGLTFSDTYNYSLSASASNPTTYIKSNVTDLEDQINNKTLITTRKHIISPSYILCNVKPIIEVMTSVNSVSAVVQDVFEDLVDYSDTDLIGINKQYRNSQVVAKILENTDVLGARVLNDYKILITDEHIKNLKRVFVPKDFIKSNNEITNEYDELKVTERTFYTDLGTTNNFERYIVNDYQIIEPKQKQIGKLFFQETENNLDENTPVTQLIEAKSNLYSNLNINGKRLNFYLYKYTSLKSLQAPLYFTDNITGQESNRNVSVTESSVNNYEIIDRWYIYASTHRTKILVAKIFKISLNDRPYFLIQSVKNSYSNELFQSIGVTSDKNGDYFYYDIQEKLDFSTKRKNHNVNLYIGYLDEYTYQEKELIKLVSRKKIASKVEAQNVSNNYVIASAVETEFNVVVTSKYTYIVDSNSSSENKLITIDNTNNVIVANKYFSSTSTYKNGKYGIEKDGAIWNVYAYETIDDTVLGEADFVNGVISFNTKVTYITDLETGSYVTKAISSFFTTDVNYTDVMEFNIVIQDQKEKDSTGKSIGLKNAYDTKPAIYSIVNIYRPEIGYNET